MSATTEQSSSTLGPLFERILCLSDSAPAGAEAVRQASILAGPGGSIELVIEKPGGVPERCTGHDLVVVPAGATALEVLSRAPINVLVSRAPAGDAAFPETILVAVDGTTEAHAAARLGAEIAARSGALVTFVASPEHDASHQHALQDDVRAVEQVTGTRPLVLDEYRGPVPSILSAAAGVEASLIVMGRRSGHATTRVSGEVAGAAECSVLVVRSD